MTAIVIPSPTNIPPAHDFVEVKGSDKLHVIRCAKCQLVLWDIAISPSDNAANAYSNKTEINGSCPGENEK